MSKNYLSHNPPPFSAEAPAFAAREAWGVYTSRLGVWSDAVELSTVPLSVQGTKHVEHVEIRGMWSHKWMSFQHEDTERFCRKLLFIILCSSKPRVGQILSTCFLDTGYETKDKWTSANSVMMQLPSFS